MNIRTYLSWGKGADEKVIEQIEVALAKDLPFGLKCQRSTIVFIPSKRQAYWIWSDLSPGPIGKYDNLGEFLNAVRGQFKIHPDFVGASEVLDIIKRMNDAKTVESLSREALPQPGIAARPVAAGNGGI